MVYTLFLQKRFKFFCLLFCCLFAIDVSHAQTPVKVFYPDSLSDSQFQELKTKFGNEKTLPVGFEKQALTALSYFPELKDVEIIFKVEDKITPLASRPFFWTMFRKNGKRTYIIIISRKSNSFLTPILLQNLSYNAQIGVLGHELSHISDFNNKKFGEMFSVMFGHLSKKQVDRFEYNTDQICIDHGLGYQLLAWSREVRKNLKITNWEGADNIPSDKKTERYMNPSTISKIIATHSLYMKF